MATQYASQAVTITAATLANAGARQSTAIATDTAVNVNDYRIYVNPTLAAGTLAGSKGTYVWVFTSEDGTNYTGNAGATDAAITLDSPHQFGFGVFIPGTAGAARGGSFSLKAACGGSVPQKWGIIVENQTGVSFSALTVSAEKEYNT